MRGGSDRLPISPFQFQGTNASQFRSVSGGPSTGRALCSCGTSPFIREASPAADVDGSDTITMSMPATFSTEIGSILCLSACATGRTLLAGIGRVYLFYLDAKSLRLLGDECRQLIEAPTILHTIVFAGFRPTTGTCRTLAYPGKCLYFDGSYTLFMGMIDDLP